MLRSLPDYDGNEDESTARHEIPVMPSVHVHMHSESELEVEPPVIKGHPTLNRALIAGLGLLASAIVAYLASRFGAK